MPELTTDRLDKEPKIPKPLTERLPPPTIRVELLKFPPTVATELTESELPKRTKLLADKALPTALLPKMEVCEPTRVHRATDIEEPSRTKLRKESELPSRTPSTVETDPPRRAKLDDDIELPRLSSSVTDAHNPTVTGPARLAEPPNRAKHLMLTELAMLAVLKVLSDEASATRPVADILEPNLTAARADKPLPYDKAPLIDNELPRRTKDLTVILLAILKLETTDRRFRAVILASPATEITFPTRTTSPTDRTEDTTEPDEERELPTFTTDEKEAMLSTTSIP
jgi:hypothetical protein